MFVKCKILCALILTLSLDCTHQARALDFYFEFTNNGTSPAAIAGTVTGAIYGLEDNAAVAPTDVVIFTLPPALQTVVGFGDNTSLKNQGWDLSGTIPVSGGQVATGTYIHIPNVDSSAWFDTTQVGYAFLGNYDGSVYQNSAFSFTPLAPVPEPSQYGVALFLAAAVVFVGRRYASRS